MVLYIDVYSFGIIRLEEKRVVNATYSSLPISMDYVSVEILKKI